MQPVIVVHGGAWALPENLWHETREEVCNAAVVGYKILTEGGSSLDAVEATILYLEDCSIFDAGVGSALTYEEKVEMDAIIMEGNFLKSGAVAAIQNVKNPIKVARLVMEKSPHVLLVGHGAKNFANLFGIENIDQEKLITDIAKKELQTYKKYHETVSSLFNSESSVMSHDTVGCVALDSTGLCCSATSTGGITAKFPGRVGDSPVCGAGAYADSEIGAVSTTGHGESIIKCCLASRIINTISEGLSPELSIQKNLEFMRKRTGGCGGAIAITKVGDVGVHFSTIRMAWAYVKQGSLHYGLHPNENECKVL